MTRMIGKGWAQIAHWQSPLQQIRHSTILASHQLRWGKSCDCFISFAWTLLNIYIFLVVVSPWRVLWCFCFLPALWMPHCCLEIFWRRTQMKFCKMSISVMGTMLCPRTCLDLRTFLSGTRSLMSGRTWTATGTESVLLSGRYKNMYHELNQS